MSFQLTIILSQTYYLFCMTCSNVFKRNKISLNGFVFHTTYIKFIPNMYLDFYPMIFQFIFKESYFQIIAHM